MKKTAAESHRILMTIYGKHALAERTCHKWFARFKCDDFGLEDEERETLKGSFACPKCYWNTKKIVIFASDCYW